MEQIECSETLAYKIQTPGNYPEENIQHTEHGESLKSRMPKVLLIFTLSLPVKVSSRRHRVGTDTSYQCIYSNFLQYPPVTFQLRDSTTTSLLTYFSHSFACTAIPLVFHPTMLKFGDF
jgi:hypothetical protein